MADIANLIHRLNVSVPAVDPAEAQHLGYEAADALKEMAAALDAAHKRIADSGWQPIESAPKDWQDVLLHVPDLESDWRTVCEGYFDVDKGVWRAPGFGVVVPTDWRPLPAPPSRIDKEDRNG